MILSTLAELLNRCRQLLILPRMRTAKQMLLLAKLHSHVVEMSERLAK
jgi:hypothetical protein